MAANTMLKRVRARKQPCFPPFVTGNESEVSPLSKTVALILSCNWRTIAVHFLEQPDFSIISHSPSLQTASNALVKSVNVMKRSSYCSWHYFLVQLAGSEDHVNGPTATSEAALTLWKYAVLQVDYRAVEHNPCQYLSCYGQERDSSVVVTKLAISLFVQVDDGRIFELLRYYFLIPHTAEKVSQLL